MAGCCRSLFALPGKLDLLAGKGLRWDLHLVRFRRSVAATNRELLLRAMERLFDRNRKLCLDIASSRCKAGASIRPRRTEAHTRPKELLKELRKIGAAIACRISVRLSTATGEATAPVRRRCILLSVLPVLAETVVLRAFFFIAQYFIRLIDLFELLFRSLIAGIDIG